MKSFLHGKKNLEAESLRPPPQFAASLPAQCPPLKVQNGAGTSSAQVEVVKEGDKVVRLIVSCVCGERVEIECLYSPGR
jgi:hypothetical protein